MSRGRPGSPVSVLIYCHPLLAGAASPPDISLSSPSAAAVSC